MILGAIAEAPSPSRNTIRNHAARLIRVGRRNAAMVEVRERGIGGC